MGRTILESEFEALAKKHLYEPIKELLRASGAERVRFEVTHDGHFFQCHCAFYETDEEYRGGNLMIGLILEAGNAIEEIAKEHLYGPVSALMAATGAGDVRFQMSDSGKFGPMVVLCTRLAKNSEEEIK